MSTKMKMLMGIVMSAACLGVHGSVIYLVDFNSTSNTVTSPDENGNQWNTMSSLSPLNNLSNTSGGTSTIGLSFGGDNFQTSDNDTQWSGAGSDRSGQPSWIAPDSFNALEYRFFQTQNNTSTITLTGLDPTLTYDFELVSATRASGTGRPAMYNILGANSTGGFTQNDNATSIVPVNGLDGTDLPWVNPIGSNYGFGFYPNATETNTDAPSDGWIAWSGVAPTAGGEITIQISSQTLSSSSRMAINAMQITAIPEPGTLMLVGIALGAGLLTLRRRR
ncbi:MAG: PEP-CTERM sorting domain-containing protein [Verrucomicrobia bacterium]|nr:PEP-CTERM sorting domain-containing protein [Verrucomicrobiota bacterium]